VATFGEISALNSLRTSFSPTCVSGCGHFDLRIISTLVWVYVASICKVLGFRSGKCEVPLLIWGYDAVSLGYGFLMARNNKVSLCLSLEMSTELWKNFNFFSKCWEPIGQWRSVIFHNNVRLNVIVSFHYLFIIIDQSSLIFLYLLLSSLFWNHILNNRSRHITIQYMKREYSFTYAYP
jgi:hypothetical protein